MPQQTAFYHQLNRLNQQQAYNALQGFAGQQHALSQQQMRASAVAGLPFMKTEQAKSPVSMDSGFQAPGGPYNAGRGAGVGGGPPSPKTKMKMAQQQEQAKMNANLNNLNLNANLNANVNLLAQMQMQASKYCHTADTKPHPHALQFPPPMQYMGMTSMSHLSPWQLAAH